MTDAAERAALSQIDPQTLADQVPANVLAAALKLATLADPCPAETDPRHYNRDGNAVPCDYHAGHEGDHQVMHRTHGWTDELEHAEVLIPAAVYPAGYRRCHACQAEEGERCRLGAHGLSRPHLGRPTIVQPPPAPANGPPCTNCQSIERSSQTSPRGTDRLVCLGCGSLVANAQERVALGRCPFCNNPPNDGCCCSGCYGQHRAPGSGFCDGCPGRGTLSPIPGIAEAAEAVQDLVEPEVLHRFLCPACDQLACTCVPSIPPGWICDGWSWATLSPSGSGQCIDHGVVSLAECWRLSWRAEQEGRSPEATPPAPA